MNNKEYAFVDITRRTADLNIQLIEIIGELTNNGRLEISEELAEMLNFCLDLNFNLYALSNEKITENADIL